ncbi:histidine phosphatase family protein [Pseudomonas oryzihabitans]|uniref:histidine phosphatase family protein n=1 Tax=Pseudomonas oryzihabitans TaxID=47885 RepID=UPI00111E376E|nr:histidine phosphatase family protein [Pseudomonas psychrotolerans]QDD91858.1 histidine phosphatase family protein [Pseudomonas psychrotolerans]
MTDCWLLRHGATEGPEGFRGRLDPPLSAQGWTQLREAVAAQPAFTLILSSPQQRCARFAEWLAAEQGAELALEPDLRELDFGDWEGRSAADLMQDQAEALGLFWADPYAYTPPGGEPVVRFAERVQAAVARWRPRLQGQRSLIVTHGGVIRLLLARQRGLAPKDLLQVEAPYATLQPLSLEHP